MEWILLLFLRASIYLPSVLVKVFRIFNILNNTLLFLLSSKFGGPHTEIFWVHFIVSPVSERSQSFFYYSLWIWYFNRFMVYFGVTMSIWNLKCNAASQSLWRFKRETPVTVWNVLFPAWTSIGRRGSDWLWGKIAEGFSFNLVSQWCTSRSLQIISERINFDNFICAVSFIVVWVGPPFLMTEQCVSSVFIGTWSKNPFCA